MKKFRQPPAEPEESSEIRKKNTIWVPILVVVLFLLLLGGYIAKQLIAKRAEAPAVVTHNYTASCTVAFAGDLSLTAEQQKTFLSGGKPDYSGCFAGISRRIAAADIAVANLEGIAGSAAEPEDNCYPPEFFSALAECGFDCLQTANTYSIRNGITSVTDTKDAVEAAGMTSVGTFRSEEERNSAGGVTVMECDGIRFAFVGFTKGLNNMRLPEGTEYAVNLLYTDYDTKYSNINRSGIRDAMEAAKAAEPDFIIALVHWGSENINEISSTQSAIADLLIECGADVIIGTHNHIVSKLEHRNVKTDGAQKDVYIAYSLGDLLTSSEREISEYGCILNMTFEKDPDSGLHRISGVNYAPTFTAHPSQTYETDSYAVMDTITEIALRDRQYFDCISEPLYERMIETIGLLQERIGIQYTLAE